jgi:alkylhydroperoxidase/carboxymuconolactone decarboxylase family protein YurZ
VGVAGCDGCIAFHTHDALRAGATPQEVLEALGIAVLMGGGPAAVYGWQALEALEQFQGPKGLAAVDRQALEALEQVQAAQTQ